MLLAVDTSSFQTGLAVYDGARVVVEVLWPAPRRHTVDLAPMVRRALRWAAIDKPEVLAVATGPGAFSGLRVGMALVKGLALAWQVPVVGVFTLDVVAAAIPPEAGVPLVAAVPIGRGRLAAAWYRTRGKQWRAESRPELFSAELLSRRIQEPTIVCGEFSPEERAVLAQNPHIRLGSPAQCARRAGYLAELAWQSWQRGHVDDPATLVPFYVATETAYPV
ncbi:MAG: tRNA (adenosine(37)-N6)-threonylcarbamoyltransferase complex dimerization subunit type 1 TsaB [Chloroflexi bacterium]|nr:tRNA (adenosine(37)-N6)-threonylcarbamoyltransferase complex dimerization subunit type 1 TsaB [Chloroflexota bacterium]